MVAAFSQIFISFPLSYSPLMFVITNIIAPNVAFDGKSTPSTSTSLSRLSIFPRTTFPTPRVQDPSITHWSVLLHERLLVLKLQNVLGQGSRLNIHSWVFHPYNAHYIVFFLLIFLIYICMNKACYNFLIAEIQLICLK